MKKRRPVISYLLIAMMFFQSLTAIISAPILILDPSGRTMGLMLSQLDNSPFNNFLIPGLFLFIVLGIVPAISSVGLIVPFSFKAFEVLNIYKDQRWSWTFAYYTGILLVLWINIQLLFIRDWDYLHLIYSLSGLAIIICVQLPSVKKYYKKNWLGLSNE